MSDRHTLDHCGSWSDERGDGQLAGGRGHFEGVGQGEIGRPAAAPVPGGGAEVVAQETRPIETGDDALDRSSGRNCRRW